MCDDFLINFHKNDIINILQDEDTTKHFSININFIVLYEHQPTVVVELLKEPQKCLEEWDRATLRAQMTLLKETGGNSQLKNNVHCRIYQLPGLSEVRRTIFPGNEDAGKFLQVSGTVLRISVAKLLEYQRNYICVKCKYSTLVKAEYDRKYIIKQPKKCGNPEDCSGTNHIAFGDLDSENCKDFQMIKIQEQTNKLGVGSMPNTMWVTLEDDLVDSCKPGDNVTICGIVKQRWGEFSKGSKIDIDIVLKANNVQVDNNSSLIAGSTPEIREMFSAFWEKYSANPLAGRDLILKSFCPQIYGLYFVKLAISIVLAGGSQAEDTISTGVRTRSESHLLLVGDPGTGKSQLLRFASKIIPRSVLTTGVGSTAAGLTVTALMEHGEWQLEGGALVMSDGGICCIDEFNSMKEHDRTSIHEAMEQQTISVAKASMVCKLNTRCSVLAACNPKGNLDVTQPLCMNLALPSPLLSRFDLILLLRDAVNEEWDTQVADYILNGGYNFSKLTNCGLWSIDTLQSYFMIIKKLNPKLSENAEIILSTYYQVQRRIDSRNKARTSIRLLESLVRLSQGHARLMFHEAVETVDCIYAIILVDVAMDSDSSILNLNVNTHSTFPEWPLRDYRAMLEAVLKKLQLQEILNKEIEILDRNKESGNSENVKSRFFNMLNVHGENEVEDNFKENVPENSSVGNTNINNGRIHEFNKNVHKTVTDNTEINNSENVGIKRKMKSSEKVGEGVKKVKKTANVTEDELDLDDFDEGYDTVLFHNLNPSRKNTKKQIATIQSIHKASTSKNINIKVIEVDNSEIENSVLENDVSKRINNTKNVKKVSKSNNQPTEITDGTLDDGYDTVSFGSSIVPTNNGNEVSSTKSIIVSTKSKDLKQNVSKGEHTTLSDTSKTDSILETSEGNTSCSSTLSKDFVTSTSNLSNLQNENKTKTVEKVVSDVKQNTIKNKLKKFKFIPKDDGSKKSLEEMAKIDAGTSKENYELNDKEIDKNDHDIKEANAEKKKSLKNNFSEFMKEDLEVLKHISCTNDDFNIDLNIDWDSVSSLSKNSATDFQNSDSLTNSEKCALSDLSQNSKLKWIHKFSSKPKFVKKLSDVTSSSSTTRSNSSSSSSSHKNILYNTYDEDIDDFDLDI